MAPTVLRPEERQRLSNQLLTGLYEFSGGTPRDRRVLLEQAGLGRFLGGLDLNGMARTVAGQIVNRLESFGPLLPEQPTYHALGALLSYLLTLGDLSPDDAHFVAELIVKYGLVQDADYLHRLQTTYGITIANPPLTPLKNVKVKSNKKRTITKKSKSVQDVEPNLKPDTTYQRQVDHHTQFPETVEQDSETLMKVTELRNVLANLYPDNASMQRIIYDSGLNLLHISLNSTPINNWHSILLEVQKNNQLEVLLNIVNSEYGENTAFKKVYDLYYKVVQTKHPDAQQTKKLSWPPLWQTNRQLPIASIDNWWKSVHLEFDPFGPEQAEFDPDLPKRAVYTDVLNQCLSSRRMAISFGATGSGKTACARLLAYSCIHPESGPPEANTYPVLHTIPFAAENEKLNDDLPKYFASILARSLAPFFVRNVNQFLMLHDSAKLAIALCLLHGFGSTERVNTQLRLRGTKDSEERKQFLSEIVSLIQDISPSNFSGDEWLDIFSNARPHTFEQTYLIVDVSGKDGQDAIALAEQVQSMIEYWMTPKVSNFYLKLLLPDSIQPYLKMPSNVVTCKLEWPDAKLQEMLSWRMRNKNGHQFHFNELFDEDAKPADPAKLLVEAAKGSPRRLIRIGNRLLEEHVRQKPLPETLSYQSLERAIIQVAAES